MNNHVEEHVTKQPETKKPNYALRRGVALGSLALAVLGGVKGVELAKSTIENITSETIVATETVSIPQNGNIINSAQEAVKDMATEKGIDYTKIPLDQIVYQSQSAADRSEGITKPGDSFTVTLSESTTGYKVSIDPAGLPTLNK